MGGKGRNRVERTKRENMMLPIDDTIKSLTRKRDSLLRKADKVAQPEIKAKYRGEAEVLESAIYHLENCKEPELTVYQNRFLISLRSGHLFKWKDAKKRAILLINREGREFKFQRSKIDPLLHMGYLEEKDDYYRLTLAGKNYR